MRVTPLIKDGWVCDEVRYKIGGESGGNSPFYFVESIFMLEYNELYIFLVICSVSL